MVHPVKWTKAGLLAIQPKSAKQTFWDPTIPGLGLVVTPAGAMTFWLVYRRKGEGRAGSPQWLKLGRFPADLSLEQARVRATELRGEVAKGLDPKAQQLRNAKAPTMSKLADLFMEDHVRPRRKPSTIRTYEGIVVNHLKPALGRMRAEDLGLAHVAKLHQSLKDQPRWANQVLAVLSKMLNLAETWGIRSLGSNPCPRIERYREGRRERYLSPAEMQRLGAALESAKSEHPLPVAAVLLLAYTGARKGEILQLRWDQVDLRHACLVLAEHKTDRLGAKRIALNQPAIEIIKSIPKDRLSPKIFAGGGGDGTIGSTLDHAWREIRKKAKLQDFRLHDLRHTFASLGVGQGRSLKEVGTVLGHASPATTNRYAHLALEAQQRVSEAIAAEMARNLTGEVS